MMNLPFDVMEIIVSKMTFQDVLTYPNVESIRQVILMCPEEWHTQLFEYIKYVRDVSKVKINASQVNSYLIMEEIDVKNNATLITDREPLFSLQKLCDGLLEKYQTTYNWRVNQFHFLLNDDVNWNIDNIKTMLHEVLLFYCHRLGFNKANIVQKINLLTPYIKGLVCHTSKTDMQKSVFQFVTNNLYDGNAELLYIFITAGEKQVQTSIWNDYCAQILDHVEEEHDLKDRLINIGTSMNWNVDKIKPIVSICSAHSLMITSDCYDLIVKGIVGEITTKKVEKLLLKDKQGRYESLCDEKLLSSGISPEHYSDLLSWECFDDFYQWNAIDKFVNTVKDIYKIKNVIAKNGIEMEDGRLYKNDISIDEYVSYVVWYKVIDDCIRLHNDSNADIDVYDIIAFIQGLFKRLFKLKKALKRKGLSFEENSEVCRDYIENGEGSIKSIIKSIQRSIT